MSLAQIIFRGKDEVVEIPLHLLLSDRLLCLQKVNFADTPAEEA